MFLSDNVLRGIYSYGFEKPSDIQQLGIPPILQGKDVVLQAPSGSGMTAAWVIPVIEGIHGHKKQSSYQELLKQQRKESNSTTSSSSSSSNNSRGSNNRKKRNNNNKDNKSTKRGVIQGLVITVGRELAVQIGRVIGAVGDFADITCHVSVGGK